MGEDVLQSVRQLEGVHVVQTILNVRVHDQLGQAKDFPGRKSTSGMRCMCALIFIIQLVINLPAEMEGVSESALLSLFGCERLDGLQVEVVVQVEIIEVLAMDEQV